MSNKTISSPLKYHGGKAYLASKFWRIAKQVDHIHRVEPYFGGGSFTLATDPEGYSEVVNDVCRDLMNFWMVLASKSAFQQFRDKVNLIPFSEPHFDSAVFDLEWHHNGDPVEWAVAFFVRCRQSMSGRMKEFAPLSRTRTRRGMNEQASAWWSAIDGLEQVHERLKRVVILNQDALDVIRSQDGPKTLFYLDPPYVHETRSTVGEYEHEMTHEQHEELLQVLAGIDGRFMLSGYASALYARYQGENGWHAYSFDLPNNSAKSETKERRQEILWTNFVVDVNRVQ